jgi:hypothetical protein
MSGQGRGRDRGRRVSEQHRNCLGAKLDAYERDSSGCGDEMVLVKQMRDEAQGHVAVTT